MATPDQPATPEAPTTQEEWSAAWKTFNTGLSELRRLAKKDGITIRLNIPTIGATKKKAKKGSSAHVR